MDPVIFLAKFKVRSFTRSWDNSDWSFGWGCEPQSWGRSEQDPIKYFAISSRGRTQGLSEIFRAPIYRAHRAVIFAVAQLFCNLKKRQSYTWRRVQ